jgi:ornithine cyclodeaminase
MACLVISAEEIRRLLPMPECIGLMTDALVTLARGDAINPLRHGIRLPHDLGILGLMPGYLGVPHTFGLKVVSVFPGNHGTGYDSHQGVVTLFETEHGCPIAILDASEITAIRTAAATAVATRLLAREDAATLALIGTGVQARTHLDAMMAVRSIREVRVFSRDANRRTRFAEQRSSALGVRVVAMDSARDAVTGADIVCTTTSSREPVVFGDWLAPGCHVNAVGSSVRWARELDTAAVLKSRLFVDRVESTVNEAGDFLFPKSEGTIDDDHIVGEIGDILTGELAGRTSPDEITLFKSLGLAVEDLAAAHYVHQRAVEQGLGVPVTLGGRNAPA